MPPPPPPAQVLTPQQEFEAQNEIDDPAQPGPLDFDGVPLNDYEPADDVDNENSDRELNEIQPIQDRIVPNRVPAPPHDIPVEQLQDDGNDLPAASQEAPPAIGDEHVDEINRPDQTKPAPFEYDEIKLYRGKFSVTCFI